MRLNRFELATAAIASLLLWGVLARYAPGGSLSTDVLWYMNVGLTGIKDPFILNRYFHVFLELLFVRVAPTPLVGVQYYWAFLVAGTSFLIYLNARLCSEQSNPLHGLFAVGIFFSLSYLASWAGTPVVDMTTMLLVSLVTALYLLSCRRHHRSIWLILIMGAVLYMGFRTKETMLIVSVLLPGLGFTDENRFNLKTFLRNIAFLLAGVAIGAIIYGVMCGVILNDLFFGWRISEFQESLSLNMLNLKPTNYLPSLDNWYNAYALTVIYIPFLLYLISGLRTASSLSKSFRLVWLIPLAAVLFLILTVNNMWGFDSRLMLPAYAIISSLAPQFIELIIPNDKLAKTRVCLFLAVAILLPVIFRFAIRSYVYRTGVDYGQFLEIIFHPILLTILLAALFLIKRGSILSWIIPVLCISGLLVSPILANARSMFLDRPNQTLSSYQYYPFSEYASRINYTSDMRMYVSSDLTANVKDVDQLQVSMLTNDVVELTSMFNVYFNTRATVDQFRLSTISADIPTDLMQGDYDYGFLTTRDWSEIESQPADLARIKGRYQEYTEPQNLIVFLIAR